VPRTGEATRARIIDAAYTLFYREGLGRVGVDEIAAHSDVTKRTLYYHFESKDALLAAVMETQNGLALSRVRKAIDGRSQDAGAVVRALFSDLAKWAARPDWHGPGFTRIVMELAGLPGHPARAMARRHKAAFEAILAERLAACGVRDAQEAARQVMLVMEGCMSLMLIHGDTRYADAARDCALQLVTSRSTSAARSRGRGTGTRAPRRGSASLRKG
jgi:AcrR family transcriptional regulator